MRIRSLSATLGVLFACVLLFNLAGCSDSATNDIFGSNEDPSAQGLSVDDPGDESGDDESTDEGTDEDSDDPCDGADDGSIFEAILVPEGETCTLNGTRVSGDVIVGLGATLVAHGVGVGGDIKSEGGASVTVDAGSGIRGIIALARVGDSRIEDSEIAMTVHLKQNVGALRVRNNRVGASVEVFENTGGVLLEQNTIREVLACTGNDPAPTGQGNTAASKEGQCADL